MEIGVGNGTVAAVLRARGFDVTTVDFDPNLNPDITADIRSLPIEDSSFDTAIAAEILEHLPWNDVGTALSELRRVVRRGAVVSVPNVRKAFAVTASIPHPFHVVRMLLRRRILVRDALWALLLSEGFKGGKGNVRRIAEIDVRRRRWHPHKFDGEHYWMLGKRGSDVEDLVTLIGESGFRIVRDFRVVENPYHHFFVLSVNG